VSTLRSRSPPYARPFRNHSTTKCLALIGRTHREVISAYLEVIELAEPTEIPRVVRDPDDDHVIAAALAARASLIVSGDRDLLDIGTFRDIRILNAADALRMLSA
jgi:predicted nucleic acid-binding protein